MSLLTRSFVAQGGFGCLLLLHLLRLAGILLLLEPRNLRLPLASDLLLGPEVVEELTRGLHADADGLKDLVLAILVHIHVENFEARDLGKELARPRAPVLSKVCPPVLRGLPEEFLLAACALRRATEDPCLAALLSALQRDDKLGRHLHVQLPLGLWVLLVLILLLLLCWRRLCLPLFLLLLLFLLLGWLLALRKLEKCKESLGLLIVLWVALKHVAAIAADVRHQALLD
mmetsp:Transcript_99934/g.322219  ORF Transcript_99934/g.322219 Transcript_99934/m.322219 type:complete len:230 (-) Transcript_99934:847-1536(-)